jgi:hypothetical protein
VRTIASTLGISAALVMCCVSGAMNYLFLSSLGKTPLEGQVLGAASAAADVLKALLPFFVAWSWQSRRFVAALAGTLAFAFFAAFSLMSGIGFAAGNRTALVEAGDTRSQSYAGAKAEIARLETARISLPVHRPASVVQEALEGQKQNVRWRTTKECTDATEPVSREFCSAYFALRAELAAAEEADRLSGQITALQNKGEDLRAQGAGQDSDPQVSLLSRILGQAPEPVRLALTIAVALLVEIGASLGLFLANGHGVLKRGPPADSGVEQTEPQDVGSVEDFCLEALLPRKTGAVGEEELLQAYRHWCEGQAVLPLGEAEFASTFQSLAQAIGLSCVAGRYRGITLADAQRMAA